MQFLLGISFIGILGTILGIKLMIRLRKRNKSMFTVILVGLIGIMSIGLYSGVTIRAYNIQRDSNDSRDEIKIVLITDLHSCSHGKNQSKLLKDIKEQAPDLILMSGDIVDDEAPILGTKELLEGLKNTVPIYYVTGNHEYFTGHIESVKNFMKKYGVNVLEEDYLVEEIKGQSLVIAGISDPKKWELTRQTGSFYQAYNKLEEGVKKEKGYKILLSHRPEFVDLYERGTYDLVVSGHAHGGQVRIPGILNGLYAPNQGAFPKYAGGMYHLSDTTNLVVSRGLSLNWRLPRVFNPPELIVITLEGNNEK